jgi:hypothetical protein
VATDLKKELKSLYNPSAKAFSIVDVPPMNFLMIDGSGDPNSSAQFAAAMEALYAVSYTAKFRVKHDHPALDYTVMPPEGLWWLADGTPFQPDRISSHDDWRWTLMIMQPEGVSGEIIAEASAAAQKKKALPALAQLRFAQYAEGQAAQIMYLGAYANEWPTVTRLHEFITEQGHQLRGKHHEIYLGNPSRTAPEKLRTIVRQPFV